jgi:hypothetical protein
MGIKAGIIVLSAASLIAIGGVGTATAAKLITGSQIKDGTITNKDLSSTVNRSLTKAGTPGATGAKGATGAQGPQGEQGPAGPAGPAGTAEYVGAHWSIVDRNVMGDGQSYLRAGPVVPPEGLGVGSLGLRTGSNTAKASFGNEVDFIGRSIPSTVSYWVYTTGENKAINAANLPNVNFEVDPNGPADTSAPNFSTLVFVPTQVDANMWSHIDATSAARWYLTGTAGTATNCSMSHYCSLAEVKAALPNAGLLSVQVGKGRDYAFSGAVDGLRIDNELFDFEPLGVTPRTVS